MRNLLVKLWNDNAGALIALEWVFVATILIVGSVTGLAAVRQAIKHELHDLANAMLALNSSFSISGQSNCVASTGGAAFIDTSSSIVVRTTAATPSTNPNSACD
jgi:hypothetical protein